jgi:hypothetical protein
MSYFLTKTIIVIMIFNVILTTGGWNQGEKDSPIIKSVLDSIKPQVEKKYSTNFQQFDLEEFRYQFVEGMNFQIKVKVSDGEFLHLIVYQPIPVDGKQEVHLIDSKAEHVQDLP